MRAQAGGDNAPWHISELAWKRVKLPACFGELELSVADLGFAAQATYWSAFDLLGGMDRNRRRPEVQTALTAKTALLVAGVAVDKHAKVRFECDAR